MTQHTHDEVEHEVVKKRKGGSTTERFFDAYRKPLMIIGLVLVVGVGGYFAYDYGYKRPKEEEAHNAFWRAYDWFMKDSTNWALNGQGDFLGFEQVIAQYPGTEAAELSHFCAGVIYRDKKDWGNALAHFQEVSVDDQAISVYTIGNMGDMYVEMGNFEEAAKAFEKAANMAKSNSTRDYLVGEYSLKAARVYLEQNNKEKAKEVLAKSLEGADKRTASYAEAEKLLNMLKAQG